MQIHELRTSRLLLRNWMESDLMPFIAMGQDERVMKYFPKLASEEATREFVAQQRESFAENGWGMWAVEELAGNEFIGFIGIRKLPYELPFSSLESPMVEIGWRLRPEWWNRGLATEGALACLKFGFETLHLKEIVSFTSLLNAPSIRVMQKIGMTRDPADDFDHPRVEEGHKIRPHLVYRMKEKDWEQKARA
ncbi:MAG: GNAT family N-acetyltransferase [Bacteroidota bacterium]|nr:GNAT family N-acetyltransferase [Bacteroidota bacterium]MDP4237131.1 GNAT family N-acetyltransferase [Bacteroidota bacterium]